MIKLQVTPPGINVFRANKKDYRFNSDSATHGVFKKIIYDFTVGATTEVDLTHGLTFVPKVWVFASTTPTSTFIQRIPIITGVGTGYDYYVTDRIVHLKRDPFGWEHFEIFIFTRSPLP